MKFGVYAIRGERVDELMVQPDTFGLSHSWQMPGGRVTATLPSQPQAHAAREGLTHFPDDPNHTWIGIDSVEIRVDLDGSIEFDGPDAHLNSNVFLSSVGGEQASKNAPALLDQGFDLWKRTLRWTSMSHNIGIDEIETRHSSTQGKAFKLFRQTDDALLLGHGGIFTMHGNQYLSHEAWRSAGEALAAGESPPPWIDFLNEAWQRLSVGELRAAVVNAAIALETVIRAAFQSTLPEIDNPVAARLLDEAAVQGLLGKWMEIAGISRKDADEMGKGAAHRIFDMRNRVMHRGLRDSAALAEIDAALPDATRFILAADELVRTRLNGPRRIYLAPGTARRIFGNRPQQAG